MEKIIVLYVDRKGTEDDLLATILGIVLGIAVFIGFIAAAIDGQIPWIQA